MANDILLNFFHRLHSLPEIKALIPMGYTPGIPALNTVNDELCVEIPFLRYKITGEKGHTLVYPIRYIARYLVPELQLVKFTDLKYAPAAGDINFDKPVGFFPHKPIENYTRRQYNHLRDETLQLLGQKAMCMLGESSCTPADEARLTDKLRAIIEPSLHQFYKRLFNN